MAVIWCDQCFPLSLTTEADTAPMRRRRRSVRLELHSHSSHRVYTETARMTAAAAGGAVAERMAGRSGRLVRNRNRMKKADVLPCSTIFSPSPLVLLLFAA